MEIKEFRVMFELGWDIDVKSISPIGAMHKAISMRIESGCEDLNYKNCAVRVMNITTEECYRFETQTFQI